MNLGHGRAFGAVSILNGTFGTGCSLAVEGGAEATWKWTGEAGLRFSGGPDDRVAQSVLRLFLPSSGLLGADVSCTTTMPPARGLKTSSSAATAMVRAVLNSFGHRERDEAVVELAAAACVDAGVTLTGARDDQCAVTFGGSHLVEQGNGHIVRSFPIAAHVAIWVPDATISKQAMLGKRDADVERSAADLSRGLAEGTITPASAMTANGRLFSKFYKSLGLPIDEHAADVALQAGALGAGLSGTGPAVAALFEKRVDLAEVPGGTWRWTRTIA